MAFFFRILIEFYNIKGPNIRPCRILITKKFKKNLKPLPLLILMIFCLLLEMDRILNFPDIRLKPLTACDIRLDTGSY